MVDSLAVGLVGDLAVGAGVQKPFIQSFALAIRCQKGVGAIANRVAFWVSHAAKGSFRKPLATASNYACTASAITMSPKESAGEIFLKGGDKGKEGREAKKDNAKEKKTKEGDRERATNKIKWDYH